MANINNPNLTRKNVQIVERILSKNDMKATELRDKFLEASVYAINFMSSPGSGKTTLLECMAELGNIDFCVIEGDLETNRDALRLQRMGIATHQITTGEACHLEALMIERALENIKWQESEFLIIENVGNLVCPASYDLGCMMNVVLLSVPEGDDKVLKYPSMFMCADAVIISKSDMIDYFGFKVEQVESDLRQLGCEIPLFLTSSKNPQSVAKFVEFLKDRKERGYVSSHTF